MGSQDSIPILLSKLEQNEAEKRDVTTLRILLDKRVDAGLMTLDLCNTLQDYITSLEERNNV